MKSECEFLCDIYELRKTKTPKPDYYLLIQLSETIAKTPVSRASRSSSTSQKNFQVASYAIMKLNNPDESLNYGTFKLPFYPVPVYNPPIADPISTTITFTISDRNQPIKSNPKQTIKSNPKPIVPKKTGMETIEEYKDDSVKDLVLDNVKPHMGIEVNKTDLIAIYVDAMRFIPNTCGVIRVSLKGCTTNLESSVAEEQMQPKMYPELRSTIMMPLYNQKRVINANIDPSTIIVGILEMFDTFLGKDAVVGYFIINLFVNKVTGAAVSSSNGQENLNVGNFQLPIFCEYSIPKPLAMEKL